MISVIVLGTGNVGTHLINAFSEAKDIELVQVYGRKKSSFGSINSSISTTSNLNDLKKDADIYILAISDDAIPLFSSQLELKNKLVVHTSGTVSINSLKSNSNKGVFYPLQTFSKNYTPDFNSIPICLETQRDQDLILLESMASAISNTVFYIDSNQRKYLHVAAVFTNNFVNHMYKIGADICENHTIPFEILHQLILETAQKVVRTSPESIQTGPAKRNDTKTITSQLTLLTDDEKKIYELLTQSIQNTYE